MADPTGQTGQDPFEQLLIESQNILGNPVSIPFQGQQGVPGGAGPGIPAPVQQQGGTLGGGGGLGGVQIGPPEFIGTGSNQNVLSDVLGFGQSAGKIAQLFQDPAYGPRGDTGGQSLSDQIRSGQVTGLGADISPELSGGSALPPGAIQQLQPATLEQLLNLSGSPDITGGSVAALPQVAGAGAEAGSEAGTEAAAAAVPASTAGLGAAAGIFAPFIIDAFENMFGQSTGPSRLPGVASEIRRGLKDVGTVLPELGNVAANQPSDIAGMTPEQLQSLFQGGLSAYGGASQLADPFNKSNKTKAGLRFPDYSQAQAAAGQLEPQAFFDTIAAQDRLAQLGMTPENAMSFPEALHALTPFGNFPTYGPDSRTATAAFDPYYGGQQLSPNPQDQLAANQAYLSGIGADPGLAGQIGEFFSGAQPGNYLQQISQIGGLLNPNFAQSELGGLLEQAGFNLGGTQGGAFGAPGAPMTVAQQGALAAPGGGDLGGGDIGEIGVSGEAAELKRQLQQQ